LPVIDVATVKFDETIDTGTGVTQRAVDITIAGLLDGGAHIVLGEASAGADGNPCATGPGPGPGPGLGPGPGPGGGMTSPPTNISPPVISDNPLPGNG